MAEIGWRVYGDGTTWTDHEKVTRRTRNGSNIGGAWWIEASAKSVERRGRAES